LKPGRQIRRAESLPRESGSPVVLQAPSERPEPPSAIDIHGKAYQIGESPPIVSPKHLVFRARFSGLDKLDVGENPIDRLGGSEHGPQGCLVSRPRGTVDALQRGRNIAG